MEHFRFNHRDQFLVPHWLLHMATFWCHMEYSMWSLFHAIWSTPYGRNLRPYGVLHRIINNVYCWRNTKCSKRLISTTPWRTPCGHYFMPHGVLHTVGFWCHMEYFRIHRSISIVTWSTTCGHYSMPYGERRFSKWEQSWKLDSCRQRGPSSATRRWSPCSWWCSLSWWMSRPSKFTPPLLLWSSHAS